MAVYDNQPGFFIDTAVSDAYTADLEFALQTLPHDATTLELGCGSGAFTQWLDAHHMQVIGVDASETQLAEACSRLPDVQFHKGNIETSNFAEVLQLQHRSFDLLTCRYVIHELADPIETFALWKRLLKPGGKLLLIENAWQRADWGEGDWGRRSDRLPLACTQTWATAVCCLRKAGYQHVQASWMDAVNKALRNQGAEGFRLYYGVAHEIEV
jgi:ubiquinone/menaquinone biosynthesis C-methylase UbiE